MSDVTVQGSDHFSVKRPPAKGRLIGDRIRILSEEVIHAFSSDGFGDQEPDGYNLKPFEALYLVATEKLVVREGRNKLDFDTLLESYQKVDPNAFSKYLIYRDLRTRGYVPKDGFGFGIDFRVYDRTHFGVKGSKFLVFGFSEGHRENAGSFQKKINEMARMGKKPVIAIIERRGEIIYYKINNLEFGVNKPVYEH